MYTLSSLAHCYRPRIVIPSNSVGSTRIASVFLEESALKGVFVAFNFLMIYLVSSLEINNFQFWYHNFPKKPFPEVVFLPGQYYFVIYSRIE